MSGTEIRAQTVGNSPDSGQAFPEEELPARVLRPFPAGGSARVVGPGRRERAYLKRLEAMGGQAERTRRRAQELEQELRHSRLALDTSRRVEKGCQRRLDRMEERLERRESELSEAHQAHKRLSLALGAMQREVEILRERAQVRLPGPAHLSLWERLIGRTVRTGRTRGRTRA